MTTTPEQTSDMSSTTIGVAGRHSSGLMSYVRQVEGRARVDSAQLLARRLRMAFWGVALLNTLGAALELASLRHWESNDQRIAWVVVVGLLVGIIGYAVAHRQRLVVWVVRLIGLASFGGAALGIAEHIKTNFRGGAFGTLAPQWDSMSVFEKLWQASSGGTGSAPPLAPGMLALSGLCLMLATWGVHRSSST